MDTQHLSGAGRLAPSPTGGLHLGHARTFLIAWLAARSQGDRVVLRVEDIDAGRVQVGMIEEAIFDLQWLGLDWDEGPDIGGPHAPYLQSRRQELYNEALDRLKSQELVYPCTCTRSDIARMASAPHLTDAEPLYPGTCRHRSVADASHLAAEGQLFAWRFRVNPGQISWVDGFQGPLSIDPSQVGGDFVVGRSTGEPAYQLAVVVDDEDMGITEVVRGDDLVSSTPRQILLYQALELPIPAFTHVPLVVDFEGNKLSKRNRAIKLSSLSAADVDPRRVVAWLALGCGWTNEFTLSDPCDWLNNCRPLDLPTTPWKLTPQMLRDLRVS